MNRLGATLLTAVLLLGRTVPGWTEEPRPGESVDGLQASLTTQSETVRRGEDVLLELELRNVSNAPFLVYGHIRPGDEYGLARLTFLVHGSDGTSFDVYSDDLIVDGIASPQSYLRLEPGGSQKTSLVMETEYEYFDWSREPAGPHTRTIDPGRYEISVRVSLSGFGQELVQDAWVGTVLSNPVIIKVVDAD